MTPEDAIRIEGQREAADQVSMANTVTSLRFCGTLDWSRFFESVSQVEQILRRDPSGVYGRMDFASRDQYRRAVEELADAAAGEGQVRVALESVDAARRSGSAAVTVDATHVGYYLNGAGRREFEAIVAFQPRARRARAPRALLRTRRRSISARSRCSPLLVVAGGVALCRGPGPRTAGTIAAGRAARR